MRLPSILVCALLLSCGMSSVGCDKKAPSADSVPAASSVPVVVDGRPIPIQVGAEGFAPSEVRIHKGEKAALVFTRTSDETCATAVSFPELKLEKPLPKGQPVVVQIPADEARTLTFQCGMGMFKSKVVVQ